LSDALVDVQRRDSTIFELKAALQVRFLSVDFNGVLDESAICFTIDRQLSQDFAGKRCRIEHRWGVTRQGSRCSAFAARFNCHCQEAVTGLCHN
jgi:hypothetical protein